MNDIDGLDILKGLPAAMIEEAVKIYYDAFSQKINPLVGDKEKAIPFIKKTTDFDACFCALRQARVLGIAGIQDKDNNFTRDIGFMELLKDFNFFRVLLIKYVYRFKTSDVDRGVLRIDSIAVAKGARGLGIGTALLKEVFRYASKNKIEKITLEVVDTNPEAKKLYDRLGFKVTKEKKYGIITKRAGFASEFIMEKKV